MACSAICERPPMLRREKAYHFNDMHTIHRAVFGDDCLHDHRPLNVLGLRNLRIGRHARRDEIGLHDGWSHIDRSASPPADDASSAAAAAASAAAARLSHHHLPARVRLPGPCIGSLRFRGSRRHHMLRGAARLRIRGGDAGGVDASGATGGFADWPPSLEVAAAGSDPTTAFWVDSGWVCSRQPVPHPRHAASARAGCISPAGSGHIAATATIHTHTSAARRCPQHQQQKNHEVGDAATAAPLRVAIQRNGNGRIIVIHVRFRTSLEFFADLRIGSSTGL